MNDQLNQATLDYQRIEETIRYLEDHFREQPDLDALATSAHLSKYHFQRLFKRWAGVSPTQFLHFLTLDYAKQRLAEAQSVYETALEAGLSGGGRLHDLFVNYEAVTPGEYKKLGAGLTISYGFHPSPFGRCLLATTSRGICALRFIETGQEQASLNQLIQEWPQASFQENPAETEPLVEQIFSTAAEAGADRPFHLYLRGTNFQIQVWRALLAIPPGSMISYQAVADAVGRPTASRAVAGAIARNPIGYLIPCHRVINKDGRFHQYRWGPIRKKAILGWEAGRQASS